MTRNDITDARLDAETLSAELRSLSAEGRASLAALREDATRARNSLRETAAITQTLGTSLRSGLSRALRDALIDGRRLSDVLRGLALDVSRSVANRAIDGAVSQVSSGLTGALGGLFSSVPIRAFAKGGVLSSPTLFPMSGGAGLAGEAGPEAILPLRRGADGRLGVAAGQGAAPNVSVTIQTPNPESFRRSQTQIAGSLARAVGRGQRNL